ncbi:hypothetical protein LCGC14_2469110 [marine sediment metagenome]|uniref:Uncharacterized protein n=1 Tax=marine sediment metagenome TaxID=412755 RepID=A0A0F9E4Y5_9ZZZZ
MSENNDVGFWAIVEIMGHKRYAGYVGEQVIGGASFVRVDVPDQDGYKAFSKLFGAQSIYCITPVSEDAAKAAARSLKEQPMSEWDLPDEWRQAISQGRLQHDGDDADECPI